MPWHCTAFVPTCVTLTLFLLFNFSTYDQSKLNMLKNYSCLTNFHGLSEVANMKKQSLDSIYKPVMFKYYSRTTHFCNVFKIINAFN